MRVAGFVALALAAAVHSLAAAGPALPDNPLAGRLLFESRNCVLCHGLAGGSGGVGPDLGGRPFRGSFLDLGAGLWNHVPGMSVSFEDAGIAWPELSAREVTELVAFLYFVEYLGHPGEAGRGEEIFRSKGCGQCHEIGSTGSGPDLADLERFASPLYIAQAIWNHGPSMLATMRAAGMRPPEFGAGELADLSAFLRRERRAGPQERVLLAPGNPNAGAELFRTRGCAICHGSAADGAGGGPDLTRADLHRAAETIAGMMWNHASEMSVAMEARGLGWPRFSTAELADLISFLYFLPFADADGNADRGAAVFSARSCGECHAAAETAPHAGPGLADGAASRSAAELVAAMWNHAPVMKEAILGEGRPWPELDGQELRDLLAFLRRGGGELPAVGVD